MKERPILFSSPMVRAFLEGRKTQTRRIIKPQPHPDHRFAGGYAITEKKRFFTNNQVAGEISVEAEYIGSVCPYGWVKDRLWVRESFWGCDLPGYGDQPCVVYDDEWHGKDYSPSEARPWARKFGRIPSIHMPRDCSRINLEITGVHVERLNDISESDAIAEGIHRDDAIPFNGPWFATETSNQGYAKPVDAYRELWESINGAGSWEANPWVWAITFRTVP